MSFAISSGGSAPCIFGIGISSNSALEVIVKALCKKASPIFVSAIKQLSFDDAMKILLGKDDEATRYLENKTREQLYQAFLPVIQSSLDEVGAREFWKTAVSAYNKIPLTRDVNPQLDDHVNQKALDGLFGYIEVKEDGIRNDLNQRSSPLLKKVFARQD